MNKVAQLAVAVQRVNNLLRERALDLEKGGLKPIDALHIACAEAARVDYFVTGDDRLINRYRQLKLPETGIIICNPTEFVRLMEARE